MPGKVAPLGEALRRGRARGSSAGRGVETVELLIDAAERLYAERGLSGVSLREIAASAGQANNSAVQYHFGDRDGLLRAVFERRFHLLDKRRSELLCAIDAQGRGHNMASLVEVLVRPFAEGLDVASGHWVRFVARLYEDPRFNPFSTTTRARPRHPYSVASETTSSTREVTERISSLLVGLSPRLIEERFFLITTLLVHATADRQAIFATGAASDLQPVELFVSDLIDACIAILAAPPPRGSNSRRTGGRRTATGARASGTRSRRTRS